MQNCTQNLIWKGLHMSNDFEGHSRLLKMAPLDMPYITSY